MGEIFKDWRDDRREERDDAVDKAHDELPTAAGLVSFRWVDDFHAHAIVGGKVVAQWWPSWGRTMAGAARGRRCMTASAFVELAKEVSGG